MKNLLNELKTETLQNTQNLWEDSEFEYVVNDTPTPDARGRWGESFINKLIKEYTTFVSVWLKDSNTSHQNGSIYDILINNYRVEVKTATPGFDSKNNKLKYHWQHENIYEKNVWDKLVLLDIEPYGFYITIINHGDMVFGDVKHNIFKKKSTDHLSGWKFDMSRKSLTRGIDGGLTIYISMKEVETCSEKLSSFLNKHFKK